VLALLPRVPRILAAQDRQAEQPGTLPVLQELQGLSAEASQGRLAMDAKEKRQMETQLLRLGLAGLTDAGEPTGELVQQIAAIVNNWQTAPNRHGEWIDRHKFMRDLLAECDASVRNQMYSAIAPHLNFKALPLASYESMITERMENLVSKGAARVEGHAPHPVEVGGRKYSEASANEATHGMATLHCQSCWKKKRFIADTPMGALIAARKAGWARMPDKWTCPSCIKKVAAGKALVN
jgi:hypothetical protein